MLNISCMWWVASLLLSEISLCLTFYTLIRMCLDVDLEFTPPRPCWASWIWRLMTFISLGGFWTLFPQTFFQHLFTSPFLLVLPLCLYWYTSGPPHISETLFFFCLSGYKISVDLLIFRKSLILSFAKSNIEFLKWPFYSNYCTFQLHIFYLMFIISISVLIFSIWQGITPILLFNSIDKVSFSALNICITTDLRSV